MSIELGVITESIYDEIDGEYVHHQYWINFIEALHRNLGHSVFVTVGHITEFLKTYGAKLTDNYQIMFEDKSGYTEFMLKYG